LAGNTFGLKDPKKKFARRINCDNKLEAKLFLMIVSTVHSLLRKAIAVYYIRWLSLASLTRWRQRESGSISDFRVQGSEGFARRKPVGYSRHPGRR
jgi:hypothetical protein